MQHATAVIPTWNRRELLERLLRNLTEQSEPFASVIVVDDGSTDGAAAAAQALGARVIRHEANRGFAAAVNAGIRAVSTPWLAVLNNDITLDRDWLARLRTAAQGESAAFAVGKLFREGSTTTLDGAYDLLTRSGLAWRCGHNLPDSALWSRRRVVSFPPFTAALFRTSLFDSVGLLDEEFGSYLEDVEFGLRCALRQADGIFVPEAIGWHRGSATLGSWDPRVVRLLAKNQLLIAARHFPPSLNWPVFVGQLLWGAVALRHGAGRAWLEGKLEAWPRFRQRRPGAGAEVVAILRDSERRMRELHQHASPDLLWRLYFRLCP